ncbi:RNA-binding KH domain-containing protein RCF3 [Lycium ferocissimum]|uniref:RNA-binding KH domain-containing protein RCF3 n=1 Tax=Lycium ferocissimum TaxID=112874 RepID=UPI0028167627|nr:RNA-binding KH domain-containing protein RCF3 [Lycium ferocissimum]
MDRSRSKRYYYDQDYDSENLPRTKQRYGGDYPRGNHHFAPPTHHRRPVSGGGGGGRKMQDPSLMVTTTYRILCHDVKAGGVIGKSGSIIKAIRQHTGAWVNVHELIPGDDERIIEISDTRRRDPDGRMPVFSPAQEALLLIHERILDSEAGGGGYSSGGVEVEEEFRMRGVSGNNRAVTRLVVTRMHVGCLLGKGGKIIEQMRMETKTHIRILPRDHSLPRCVSMSEEIVQVVGEMNAVKKAVEIISSRLRESQHRDRGHFPGRQHSPERFVPPDDEFIPHMNNRRMSENGSTFGSRLPASMSSGRSNNFSSSSSGYAIESGISPGNENGQVMYVEDLVFRILCPVDKVDTVAGESDGIIELLQNEIGVDVKILNPVASSDEQVIIITSDEGPDDELFPAQEALLHIQTRIVDLAPDKENVITTRLVVQTDEVECLGGRDGLLSEMQKITGATVKIVPKEELPPCVSGTDEIIQIVGEITAAREALVEVTSRLRSYTYREFFQKDIPSPAIPASSPARNTIGADKNPFNNTSPSQQNYSVNDVPTSIYQNAPAKPMAQPVKETGVSASEIAKQNESERREDIPSGLNRTHVTLVTRSILEVVIPPHAAPKLITKSRNKLAQISELSGANVKLVEDRPEVTEKIIQISGTPEQAERAQSLLQGFILSTLEDEMP